MKAITLWQPFAYLAGCLKGDAWLSAGRDKSPSGYLCLRVADEEFAQAFAEAINTGYGLHVAPRRDERGYWLTRVYNGHTRFTPLLSFCAESDDERAAWLRGLFDSEGNTMLMPVPKQGPRSWYRRVSFYSTNETTLDTTAAYLLDLGLPTRRLVRKPTVGHLGNRPVFELSLRHSRENFATFAHTVGSSIPRKQKVLDSLAPSYCDDLSEVRREMQAKGVLIRIARRETGGRY